MCLNFVDFSIILKPKEEVRKRYKGAEVDDGKAIMEEGEDDEEMDDSEADADGDTDYGV